MLLIHDSTELILNTKLMIWDQCCKTHKTYVNFHIMISFIHIRPNLLHNSIYQSSDMNDKTFPYNFFAFQMWYCIFCKFTKTFWSCSLVFCLHGATIIPRIHVKICSSIGSIISTQKFYAMGSTVTCTLVNSSLIFVWIFQRKHTLPARWYIHNSPVLYWTYVLILA